jgi:hypothetical protein
VLHIFTFADFVTEVTPVGWEHRERGARPYYYHSERDEAGRVRKRYIGTGDIAEIIAHDDETRRRAMEARQEQGRKELERMEALAAPVVELDEVAAVLVRAHLIAGGCHRHKGQWRIARAKQSDSPA